MTRFRFAQELDRGATRLAARQAGRQRVLLAILVVLVGSIVLLRAPWSLAPTFSVACILLGIFVGLFVFFDDPTDILSAGKLASLLFGASFAIGPLFLGERGLGSYALPYFGFDVAALTGATATMAALGFLCLVVGYMLLRARARRPADTYGTDLAISQRQARYMTVAGLIVGFVGVSCYIVLVTKAGGIGYFLSYTAGRADIFRGVFGGWFWGMLLMFPGYALVAAPAIRRHPWLCLAGALSMSLAFFPLQGRDLLVAPVFCWLVLFHYGYRRVTWHTLAVGFMALVIASAFLGAFRSSTDVDERADTGGFVSKFFGDIGQQMLLVVAQNIEQLDAMAVAVKYVERERDFLGPMALLSWIEPFDRQLFGQSIDTIEAGQVMDNLLFPEHVGWNTALSPSLPGELYISLGWFGLIAGMLLYGCLLAVLSRWVALRWKSPVLFAAYPFVSYMVIKMVVDGTGQIFRVLVVLSVILGVNLFAPRGTTRR